MSLGIRSVTKQSDTPCHCEAGEASRGHLKPIASLLTRLPSRQPRHAERSGRSAFVARNDRKLRGLFVLLASTFHEDITNALTQGALDTLTRRGIALEQIRILRVPGAFELPGAAAAAARSLRPCAIIAVGCVLKGETPQYLALGQAVLHGLTQVAVIAGVPVTAGVILADSIAQARARAGGRVGNRGSEAAEAALQIVALTPQLTSRT